MKHLLIIVTTLLFFQNCSAQQEKESLVEQPTIEHATFEDLLIIIQDLGNEQDLDGMSIEKVNYYETALKEFENRVNTFDDYEESKLTCTQQFQVAVKKATNTYKNCNLPTMNPLACGHNLGMELQTIENSFKSCLEKY